ncbi:MAG: formate dehydrogenase accessory sulfurtransferase FdhD [Anaerolineales bacterium]|jgi:FdhD protein
MGRWETVPAKVIGETSVTLTVNGEVWLGLMCTPVDLEALAVGFIVNEGLLHDASEIASVRVCPTGDNVDVWLNHAVERPANWRRTSGCTGGMTSTDLQGSVLIPPLERPLTAENLLNFMGMLYESQSLYKEMGGVHTTALCNGQTIVLKAEDVGRHNTLDKLAGRMLLEHIEMNPLIVLTTGRISSEMLQKAARMGASVVASRTSPTSLSVQLAEHWNMTLIGYTRRDQFTIYAHPENIEMDQNAGYQLVLSEVSAVDDRSAADN